MKHTCDAISRLQLHTLFKYSLTSAYIIQQTKHFRLKTWFVIIWLYNIVQSVKNI
uniref:Uncharacterized protein n=1 Tax=Rhizophora mucronata TaxID=61149 RepID=A0A2P2MXL8_RHIMU